MKLICLLLLTVFCLTPFVGHSQKHPLGGIKFDDKKYKAVPLKESLRSSPPGSAKSLRKSINISKDFIDCMYQGHIPSCMVCASASTLAIRRKGYFNSKFPSKKPLECFSPSYLFNQLCPKNHCDAGVYPTDVLDSLVCQGICLQEDFHHDPYGCSELPTDKHKKIAGNYKIEKYKRIFELEEECSQEKDCLEAFKEELVNNTITQIDSNNPVIVVLKVTKDFRKLSQGVEKWSPKKRASKTYGHAMVAIGYDDKAKEFEFLNSYGTRWGDDGFIKISYDDFIKVVRYGFIIYLDKYSLDCGKR